MTWERSAGPGKTPQSMTYSADRIKLSSLPRHQFYYRENHRNRYYSNQGRRHGGVGRAGVDGQLKVFRGDLCFTTNLRGDFLIIVWFQYSKLKPWYRTLRFRMETKLPIFLCFMLFLLNISIKAHFKGWVGNASYTRKSILCPTEEIVQTQCILS